MSGHPSTKEEISDSLDLDDRPLDVLLTLLAALGLVKRRDNIFTTTEISEEFLVGGRPNCLVPFFASQKNRPSCLELYEVLKTGEPAGWSSQEKGRDWESLMGDDLFASGFTAAMDSRGAVLAPAMARAIPCESYSNILDVAGGSGVYACAVVKEHRHMKAAVLEKPPVDEVARATIARKGFSDRVEVIGSDMFAQELPRGFDIHLWSHVLHDWGESDVRLLLCKSFESLNPGGMVVIHDAHVNAEKTGPLPVARFSVLLMHSTKGKCYIGYVRIVCELDLPQAAPGDHTPTLELFRQAINSFIDSKVAGIVVDVRSNSGGSDQMVADFMSSFYKEKTLYEYANFVVPATGQFEIWKENEKTGEYVSPGQGTYIQAGSKVYTGPVVALVNNGCISSGEGVAMGIKNLPKGKVVGFYGTNGSFGMAGDSVKMPAGYEVDWPFGQSLDKNKVVQVDSKGGKGGVLPNKSIPMTLDNALKVASGHDVELEYGLKALNQMR